MDTADALLLVGRLTKPHGIRGELKLLPDTDDPARLRGAKRLFVGESAASARERKVEGLRAHQTGQGLVLLVRFADLDTPDAAEALRGLNAYAHRDDLPPLEDDEFYLDDLEGCAVVDERLGSLGVVREILDLPSHPVLVVERTGADDLLVPLVDAFVLDVDLDAETVTVRAADLLDPDTEG